MSEPAAEPAASGRRLTPEARRRQLLDAARGLISANPQASISTADVAAAAGVTRALVHHYFRGIGELREALALDIVKDGVGLLEAEPEATVPERVRANVAALLDVVDANRDIWLATMSFEEGRTGESAAEFFRASMLERIVTNNADVFEDSSWARLCLSGYLGFCRDACRNWVLGESTRVEVEAALTETLIHLITETIPNARPGSYLTPFK